MRTTLVLPERIANDLCDIARLSVETGGVLLARVVTNDNGSLRLLAHDLHLVPDSAYAVREKDGLEITSAGYVPPLRVAEDCGSMAIWMHTHPGSGASVRPSHHDQVVDQKLAELFRIRTGSDSYGALIVASSESDQRLRFSGHVDTRGAEPRAIDRVLTVGSRMSLVTDSWASESVHGMFDRNIRAFGGAVQSALAGLRVAIVGCGGTGSCVAEQIARLGVRDLLLVDPEALSESNLTRVYGSVAGDVGRPKVLVIGDHLRRIAPGVAIEAIQGMVTRESVARRLADVDVVFGCTDDNAGRLVLSRLSTFMMTPVIDCGVLLSSSVEGQLIGIDGRVTLMYPGAACLVCRGRIDLQRAMAEGLSPDERKRRVDEGYAPALGRVEPAVVPYTTAVAAAAVGELLNMLIGYGPEPDPTELLLRIHERETSGNVAGPRAGHYCDPAAGKIGRGFTTPFLEQTWPA